MAQSDVRRVRVNLRFLGDKQKSKIQAAMSSFDPERHFSRIPPVAAIFHIPLTVSPSLLVIIFSPIKT